MTAETQIISRPKALVISASLCFIIAVSAVASVERSNYQVLLPCYVLAFMLYVIALKQRQYWQSWLVTGIVTRTVLLLVFPNLSDDIYRFFWDGTLTVNGLNPYGVLPTSILQTHEVLPPALQPILPFLNSPEYYTIYPGVCQSFFALGALLSGSDITVFTLALKCLIFVVECGSLWLLYRLLQPIGRTPDIILYALNPLVIIELVGNLHFEAVMIFFLLVAYWFLQKGQLLKSAWMFALAISTKLIPILFMPFLFRRIPRRSFLVFTCIAALISALFFAPVIVAGAGTGYLSSLDLYFRQFEFNASFYYLARFVSYLQHGYNTISGTGPLMALIAVALLFLFFLLERKPGIQNFPRAAITALTIYPLFATTVHPWYICTLIAFCPLTHFRYPVVWSGLIFFSYLAYRTEPPSEMLWAIALEYIIVIGWFLFEWRRELRPESEHLIT